MKFMKSMVLSTVAALIVAAGPEAAAPVVGMDVAAEAAPAKPSIKCKNPTKYKLVPAGTKLKNGKTTKRATCILAKAKKPLKCKAGSVAKTRVMKLESGKTRTTTRCMKKAVKPIITASSCKAGQVFRAKGAKIGGKRGKPKFAKAAACVPMRA
jgi:hypothetical protein